MVFYWHDVKSSPRLARKRSAVCPISRMYLRDGGGWAVVSIMRSSGGTVSMLLRDWVGVFAAVGPQGPKLKEEAEKRENKGEEDKGLIGSLASATNESGCVEEAVVLVVVLGGKYEGSEPEIGEDQVDEEHESAEHVRHERRDEGR